MNRRKFLQRILLSQTNVRFNDLCLLAGAFGFRYDRTSGSHHIYVHAKIPELMNFQNVHGQIKPYQVRQFLSIIEKYNLELGDTL